MSKEEKIANAIRKIATGEDGVEWVSEMVMPSICSDVRVATSKGFKYTFRTRDGIITDLLVGFSSSGKKGWSTQDPENYNKKNPGSYLSEQERITITRKINQRKLGFKITIQETYILYVNGSEVKPFVFDKGPVKGIKYPAEEIGSNRFSDKASAIIAAKAFKKYYTAWTASRSRKPT